jgi:selenide,water dikinase
LTKPLGTGTSTAALKRGEVDEDGIREVIDSMSLLNDVPAILPSELLSAVHAATDITGFGLAGHALNLARASGATLRFERARLPIFARAFEFLERGFLTKAHRTNAEYIQGHARLDFDHALARQLIVDPQTSGGLLLAVAPAAADELLARLRARFPAATRVGVVESAGGDALVFT